MSRVLSSQRTSTSQRALCHDLTQYVTAAMLVTTLPGDEHLDPRTRHRFGLIHRQLAQMQAVLTDAMTETTEDRSADVVELVRECVEANGVRQQVELIAELPSAHLRGDHTVLRRAVNNMLDNAARAAPGRDPIVVRVSGTEGTLAIEVQDTGVGFGRLESGRGLGMVSVADALEAFGGSLEITSGPGPGTLVRLLLPRRAP